MNEEEDGWMDGSVAFSAIPPRLSKLCYYRHSVLPPHSPQVCCHLYYTLMACSTITIPNAVDILKYISSNWTWVCPPGVYNPTGEGGMLRKTSAL